MKYEEITLNQLFRQQDFHEEKVSEIEIKENISELKRKITQKDARLKWKNVLDEVFATSSKLLNIGLKEILESAWSKYEEVKKYLDEDKFDTDETFLIPLVKHTIVSNHNPKIEIRIGEIYVGEIDFELNLELILSGIILKINQGKIQGVKAGKCRSKGIFACEGIALFEDSSSELEFNS